jgi:hypothetical protein
MDGGALGEMRAAARARAAEFSWDSFTARLDDVLEDVAARRAVRRRAP